MIILDTNVLSELIRKEPDARVSGWIAEQSKTSLFITSITQAEILYGLALLPDGRRKDGIVHAARVMFNNDFSGRILPFDVDSAMIYPEIAAHRRLIGRPISQFDAQIASIAWSRGARLATRNVQDFLECGIEVINPWDVDKA